MWALVVFLSVGAIACTKRKTVHLKGGYRNLLNQQWRVKEVLASDSHPPTNYHTYRFEFKANGVYILSTQTGTSQGTWELVANEQRLILDKGRMNEDVATILACSPTRLDLEFTEIGTKQEVETIIFRLIR